MLQSFVDANRNLGGECVSAAEDRCADDARKSGVDQDLAAEYDEAAVKLRVVAGSAAGSAASSAARSAARSGVRMMNAIDFASSHLAHLRLAGIGLVSTFYEVLSLPPAAKSDILAGLSGTTKVVPFHLPRQSVPQHQPRYRRTSMISKVKRADGVALSTCSKSRLGKM